MNPQVFVIAPDRFERLKAVAAKAGLSILADSGAAAISTGLGAVRFEYSYDRPAQSLSIKCVGKPWLVKESKVIETVQTMVTATA